MLVSDAHLAAAVVYATPAFPFFNFNLRRPRDLKATTFRRRKLHKCFQYLGVKGSILNIKMLQVLRALAALWGYILQIL